MRQLTSDQWGELIDQYVQLVVDSMDYKSMEQFVYQTLQEDFDKCNQMEMKDEIELSFDSETYRDLLNSIGEREEEKYN